MALLTHRRTALFCSAHTPGDAAYLLHLDGIPAGGLENWRDGKGWESWRFDIGRALTPAELDALRTKAGAASARWMAQTSIGKSDT